MRALLKCYCWCYLRWIWSFLFEVGLEQVQQAPSFWAVNSSSQLKMDHLKVMFNVFMLWWMVFKMSSTVENVYYCRNFSTGNSTTNLDMITMMTFSTLGFWVILASVINNFEVLLTVSCKGGNTLHNVCPNLQPGECLVDKSQSQSADFGQSEFHGQKSENKDYSILFINI